MSRRAPEAPGWLDRQAYPFTLRDLELSAGRMHYADEGSGEVVLLVHGTPTWSFEYRHLIKALAPARRCIAPDLLGFGLSERPLDFSYTPQAHAKALSEFVEKMGSERFTLIVHDYGGPIALPLALDAASRVNRLVLMNTWMWPFDDDVQMQRRGRMAGGVAGRLLYRYANASLRLLMPSAYGDRSKLTPEIHRQYLEPFRRPSDRVLVLHTLARAILGSRDYYADLWRRADELKRRPALLLWGMKDIAFDPRYFERWASLLPDARAVQFADAGHWPHEEEPARVARAIQDFLGSV
jgi:haloalkane dehalogenase